MQKFAIEKEKEAIMNCFFDIYKSFPHFYMSLHNNNQLSKDASLQPIVSLIKLNHLIFLEDEMDLNNTKIPLKLINKLFKMFKHILISIDKGKETNKGIFNYEIFTKENKRFYVFRETEKEYTLKYYFIIDRDNYHYRQQVKLYYKGLKLSDSTKIRDLKDFLSFIENQEKVEETHTIESLEMYYALFMMLND